MDAEAAAHQLYVTYQEADAFAQRLLVAHGTQEDGAATVAHSLVRADLRGVDSHGIRLLPMYLKRLDLGLINPRPQLSPERVAPAAARLDGENAFGAVVATRAMEEAMAIANAVGLGVVSVRRSTHFGMAANYILQALEANFVAIVFTNASPGVPPWGGRTAFLGTSPIAVGVPGGRLAPFVLDMSPAVAARGKVLKALRRGERIPDGWALDDQGRPTTDPAAALRGVQLPLGPKGAALSMWMDIFCGVLSGAAFAGDVANQREDLDRPQNVGHFFLAMRPELFIPGDAVYARMDMFVERLRALPRAEGFNEILMPGEPEAREERIRRRRGIPFSLAEIAPLQEAAASASVAELPTAEYPFDM